MANDTEPAQSSSAAVRRATGVTLLCMVATVVGADRFTARLFEKPVDVPDAAAAPTSFVELSQAAFPPPPSYPFDGPQLLLIGNSHTYSLPSPTRGLPMQATNRGILPDRLGRRLGGDGSKPPGAYLLSYPNFLPYEMLTRTVQLQSLHYRPQIVVLGLTWRNLARDSRLREQVYLCYRDPTFADTMRQALTRVDPDDAAPILQAVDGEARRRARDLEAERMKSQADRIDERLFDRLRSRIALMEYGVDLRTRIYRLAFDSIQRTWEDVGPTDYSYDLIELDFAFNRHCLRAMLERWVDAGSQVVVYYAPERSDLPPLLDPARQTEFMHEFDAWCQKRGITTVDARRVVPNEHWGWDMDTPDRSHFTEQGHRLLADFLLTNVEPLRKAATQGGAAER